MKQDNDKLFYYYLIIFGTIPVGWFALLMAPAFDKGADWYDKSVPGEYGSSVANPVV